MEISLIKKKMLKYRDTFGYGLDKSDIANADNINRLSEIIDEHEELITQLANEVKSSLSQLKTELGLTHQK